MTGNAKRTRREAKEERVGLVERKGVELIVEKKKIGWAHEG